jgi:Ca-activated chloride channel family protein
LRVQSPRKVLLASLLLVGLAATAAGPSQAQDQKTPCTEDAMIVFDASGSMAGNLGQGIMTEKPRIFEVRRALSRVLPIITQYRKVGLITYGPGPYRQCNVHLDLKPIADATEPIMTVVTGLNPSGKTPLTEAVEQAAEVLDHQRKPGVVVLLTDGEETCNRDPCELGKKLTATSSNLTVHVIGFQMKNFTWTGESSVLEVKCLAKETGGLYISAQNEEDLVKAFQQTLGCPIMSGLDSRHVLADKSLRAGDHP